MATSKKPRQQEVTLSLDSEELAFAERQGQGFGYSGTADYLQGLLNMAVLREMDEVDTPDKREIRDLKKLVAMQDMRIRVLKELLNEETHRVFALLRERRELTCSPEERPDPLADKDDIPF